MNRPTRKLGDPSSAELLLKELYLDLRRSIRAWSAVTRQTPQARMGYVGQHLASVVTGFPGGRSGARGYDLVLPDGRYAEIKTCYRVDQLGKCPKCGAAVSSIEDECPICSSVEIARKDDSKWLIGIRNDDEMRLLFDPVAYYLVLFDFAPPRQESAEELTKAESADITIGTPSINARIWQVDAKHIGFCLCMVDYYVNIRANSTSKAPFNLWPFSLKFQLMRPALKYHAVIEPDDSIETLVFAGEIGESSYYPISPLTEFAGSRINMPDIKLIALSEFLGVSQPSNASRRVLLQNLQNAREQSDWDDDWLAEQLAELIYRDQISESEHWLPAQLRST